MGNFWQGVSNRWLYLAGALFAGALMGFALFLQYVRHQDPCPLCMVQRVFFIALLVMFALAALHGPKRLGARRPARRIFLGRQRAMERFSWDRIARNLLNYYQGIA